MRDCIIADSDEHKALCSGNSVTSDTLLSPTSAHDVNFRSPQMSDIYVCHLGWMPTSVSKADANPADDDAPLTTTLSMHLPAQAPNK